MKKFLLTITLLFLVLMMVLPRPQAAMVPVRDGLATDSRKPVDAAGAWLSLQDSSGTVSGQWSFQISSPLAQQAQARPVLLVRLQQSYGRSGVIPMDEQWPDFQRPEGPPDCKEAGYLIFDIAGHCGSRLWDKMGSYGFIAATGVGAVMVATAFPVTAPAFPQIAKATGIEVVSEGVKDLLYCFGATVIDRSDSSESTKKAHRAALEDIIEALDTIKDIWDLRRAFRNIGDQREKAEKIKRAQALKNFWSEYWKEHVGDLNAFELTIKNAVETWQRGVKWIGQLNKGAEDRSRAALADAEGKINECKFEEAQSRLEDAVREGLLYLDDLRRMMIENRNTVRCLEREVREIQRNGGAPSGTGAGLIVTRYNSAVEAQPLFEKKKTDYVKYLPGIRDRYKEVLKVLSLRRDADAAVDSCNLASAEAGIKEIRALRFNPCAYQAIQQKLDKKRAEVERDEKTINDLVNRVASAPAGSIPCADIESAIGSIERLLSTNRCLNALDTAAKVTSLRNTLSVSTEAATEMLQALGAGRTALAACDLEAARKAAALARLAFGKMKCVPSGIGTPGATDIQALENAIKSSADKIKEFERRAADLLADATRAAANCDTARLNSAAEQMAQLISELAAVCPSMKQDWLKQMNDLAQGSFKNKPAVEEAISEGKKSAKKCDAQAVRAAARKVEGFGPVCGIDLKAEADRLKSMADSIDSIETDIRKATEAVKAAVDSCDPRAADLAMSEVNRLADSAQARCPKLAQSVSSMVRAAFDSVEKLKPVVKASQDAAQEALKDLNAGRAALANCDFAAARKASGLGRQAVGRITCLPSGSAPSESDFQALDGAIASAERIAAEKRREFEARAAKLLSDASAAARNCDFAAIDSAIKQMAQLLKEQKAACVPPNQAWLTQIQGIAQDAQRQGEDIRREISQAEKAAKECNAQAVRAAAARLMAMFPVCSLDPKAEAARLNALADSIESMETDLRAANESVKSAVSRCDLRAAELAMAEVNRLVEAAKLICPQLAQSVSDMIRNASESIAKLKSYRATLESSVNGAGKAVKAAVTRCDLPAAQSAMGELNRIVDAATAQCRQLPDSVSQVTQESFASVEKLRNDQVNLLSNVKAAVGVVEAEVRNCNLRAAEIAMAEVNRIADRCAQITGEIPRLVRSASDRVEALKRSGSNIRGEIESARNQGVAALNACNPDQAVVDFSRAISLYEANQACAGPVDVSSIRADLKAAERLKTLSQDLKLELSEAERMVSSCSGGFTPGYFDTALRKLNRAGGILTELRSFAGCARGAEESRVSAARQNISRILTARESVNSKLVRARAYLNTTGTSGDSRTPAQQAKGNLEMVRNLLSEAREQATPPECFRDLLTTLEGLATELEKKRAGLGVSGGDDRPTDEVPGALGNSKPTEEVPTALGRPTGALGAPLPPRRPKNPGDQSPTNEVPGVLGSGKGKPSDEVPGVLGSGKGKPSDEVPGVLGSGKGKPTDDGPGAVGSTGDRTSSGTKEQPSNPNKPGKGERIGKVIGAILGGLQQPKNQHRRLNWWRQYGKHRYNE